MFKTTMIAFLFSSFASAHPNSSEAHQVPQTVLTNLDQALALKAVILSQDTTNNLAIAYLQPQQMEQLALLNHFEGHCGGYEVLSQEERNQPGRVLQKLILSQNRMKLMSPLQDSEIEWKEEYQKLADQADPNQLKETVQWISSYPSRNDKLSNPNQHVVELKSRLENWLQGAKWPFSIEMISHKSTRQNSLRLTIPGRLNSQDVIVLGAHFDSVNQSFFGGSSAAPGADDNASGSSNLIEALKILKNADQPERTLEFYWYAGEESGLLGSAEIAKSARAENKNVLAVLQLDMTLYPGSGEQVIGLVNDFTSPWLRDVLSRINDTYVKARFVDDKCGYGCSDHASWHRQNYHAVTPFEAVTKTMNRNIHTDKDVISAKSSFTHSNSFTKYAILFALVLGNSDLRPPVR